MGVSKNRGIPKWMVKIMVPNPIKHGMIWGVFNPTIFWVQHPYRGKIYQSMDRRICLKMLRSVSFDSNATSEKDAKQAASGAASVVDSLLFFSWRLGSCG